jgi:hypothetical protein
LNRDISNTHSLWPCTRINSTTMVRAMSRKHHPTVRDFLLYLVTHPWN